MTNSEEGIFQTAPDTNVQSSNNTQSNNTTTYTNTNTNTNAIATTNTTVGKPSELNGGNNYTNRKKSLSGSGSEESPSPLSLPFVTVCAEKVLHLGQTTEGTLAITNYRLYIQAKATNYNIPLGLIDMVEGKDIFFLHVSCKDARSIKCTFPNNESLSEVLRRIQALVSFPKTIDDSFAITFYERTEKEFTEDMKLQLGIHPDTLTHLETAKERFDAEIKRMEFNVNLVWRVSDENAKYELCDSYPPNIIVPISIDKKKLEQVACFRSARRFPAVVWRHRGNGAVICRCSQPEVGWFGWRSTEDEELVQNIIQACAFDRANNLGDAHTVALDNTLSLGSSNSIPNGSIEYVPESPNVKKLLLLDARSYSTAVVNRARGGGCECLEYYPNCEIQFMNLANIHSIRKSFANVRQLCALPSEQANWYSQLENCKWLQHMSGLMKAAVTVVTAIENDGRPVMVHCSDGWDRTPQIVSLAEILLDPYYRSLKGFQVLVEREWLDFGHKFADRCGQGVGSDDGNERCPVFLQWLDCLHQLVRQFPTTFEFNLTFLVKLAQHTYSNLFGTFLCNTAKEREQLDMASKTHSVWRFLRSSANHDKFRNSLYTNNESVLWPSCEVRDLVLWTQVYLGYENPPPILTDVVNPSQESSPTPSVAAEGETSERLASCKTLGTKTRSCEDLANSCVPKGIQRKLSDSSLRGSFHGTEDLDISQSKENLLQSATVEDLKTSTTSTEPMRFFIDSENEDEMELNSENLSESTIVNTHKRRINLKSIESSTDTLVAEYGVLTETKSPVNENGTENHLNPGFDPKSRIPNQIRTHNSNGQLDNTLFKEYNAEYTSGNGVQQQNTFYHPDMVNGITKDDLAQLSTGYNLNLESAANHCEVCETSRKLVRDIGVVVNGFGSSSNSSNGGGALSSTSTSSGIGPSSGSKYSSYNTPIHSRTPSTGIPATPCNEEAGGKQGDANCLIGAGTEGKSTFDVDGLTSLHCEVQSRLYFVVNGYRTQIEALQKDLQLTRMALMKQVGHKCTQFPPADLQDDSVSLSDSQCSEERQSVGQGSNSSELSWEAVDEKDTRPPLWVPDFAVTQCMGCDRRFWMGMRKHHCRSCGKVFCADCSDASAAIPSEQIFKPVRVCRTCFSRLNQSSSDIPFPEEKMIPTDSSPNGQNSNLGLAETSSSVPSCASRPDFLNTAAPSGESGTEAPSVSKSTKIHKSNSHPNPGHEKLNVLTNGSAVH